TTSNNTTAIARRDRFILQGNKFRNLCYGWWTPTNASNLHIGPMVDEGGVYENVGTRYNADLSATTVIYPGRRQGDLVTVWANAPPMAGYWKIGDQWWTTTPTPNTSPGGFC